MIFNIGAGASKYKIIFLELVRSYTAISWQTETPDLEIKDHIAQLGYKWSPYYLIRKHCGLAWYDGRLLYEFQNPDGHPKLELCLAPQVLLKFSSFHRTKVCLYSKETSSSPTAARAFSQRHFWFGKEL